MEGLQLTFSKSDSIYEAYRSENQLLKEEVEQLKTKIESIEVLVEHKHSVQQEEIQLLSSALDEALDFAFQEENVSTSVQDEAVFQEVQDINCVH